MGISLGTLFGILAGVGLLLYNIIKVQITRNDEQRIIEII